MIISWRLQGLDKAGNEVRITPSDMQTHTGDSWSGHPLFGKDLTVEIKRNGGMRSRLSCSGVNKDFTLTKIIYPAFELELTDDVSMFFSESQGVKVGKLKSHEKFIFKPEDPDFIYESRFRSMRFAAIMFKEESLFIGLDDTSTFSKSADLYRDSKNGKLFLDIITPMPLDGKSTQMQPYEILLTSFKGDWYEAAMLYKELLPLERKRLPRKKDLLRDVAIWLWNRDHSSWVIPPAEQLQKDSGVPVALDWYWYHQHPYDTHYPDFYPPREGVEAFTNALSRLRNDHIFSQVYTNGFLWDMENENWNEGGSEGVIKNQQGKEVSTPFNAFMKHEMAYMCGEAKKFHARLIDQIGKIAACGLDGIYVDMIGCATMEFCYNKEHKHAPGGGCYMAAGYRAMLKELHERNPELYISTEDCNETYMDMVDSVISIMSPSGERYGYLPPFEFVPAFSAVHHGSLVLYGSNAHIDGIPPFDTKWPQEGKWKHEEDWNAIAPNQFFVELGRCIIWGQQPMVANLRPEHLTNPALKERYDFICSTAKFYYANRDLLFDGKLLHPGVMECGKTRVEFIVRYIFTEEGNYKVVYRDVPNVLHGVWQNQSGESALIVLNFTDKPQKFHFESAQFNAVDEMLSPREYRRIPLQAK